PRKSKMIREREQASPFCGPRLLFALQRNLNRLIRGALLRQLNHAGGNRNRPSQSLRLFLRAGKTAPCSPVVIGQQLRWLRSFLRNQILFLLVAGPEVYG